MPKFNYVAMDSRGKETKGSLDVANQNEAISRLKEMGYFPTKVTEAEKPKEKPDKKKSAAAAPAKGAKKGISIKIPGFGGKVKPKVLTTFTRQLATLVDAGLPLLRGMRVLEKQEKNATLRRIIVELAASIEGGSTFSEGLAQHPKVFNRLFVNMVKAGELGGVLEIVLARLAQFMEKAQKIKGKIKAALFYPVAVMIVAGGVVAVLMVFVVPRFKIIFNDLMEGADLPGFTLFVLGASEFLASHILPTILGFITLFVMLKLVIRTKFGRMIWDRIALSFPLLGPVVSKVAIARFARTLGTLLSSGVPILQALTIVKETSGNVIVGNAVTDIHESVKEGHTITAPMDHCSVFPATVIGMVDVGEQTGALPEMLMKVADDYEEDVDNAVSALTSLLEPIMIVFLAIVVGSIVIALFLPLVRIIEDFGDPGNAHRSQTDSASAE